MSVHVKRSVPLAFQRLIVVLIDCTFVPTSDYNCLSYVQSSSLDNAFLPSLPTLASIFERR